MVEPAASSIASTRFAPTPTPSTGPGLAAVVEAAERAVKAAMRAVEAVEAAKAAVKAAKAAKAAGPPSRSNSRRGGVLAEM